MELELAAAAAAAADNDDDDDQQSFRKVGTIAMWRSDGRREASDELDQRPSCGCDRTKGVWG